ncbi:ADP-ribosylation factor 1-like [Mercenaria mercenaria]|uniref:ADP-ribosylation factor 1-like n=1 Tax=Mercenaria mercenaria TaxID=6596 RepID=UPI00234EB1C8|nr:ADP-ribosylation factor 1-like [Mercenaria mercenaria]
MGLLISKLAHTLFIRGRETRILMLGLDNAGKTTVLYKIKLNETMTTIPTIGFNVENLTPVKGVTFTVWDVGGQDRIRALWRHYFNSTEGIVYVVDSSDMERIEEAREELFNVLESEELKGVPIVVFANKQDMLDAMSASEIAQHLYLNMLTGRNWCVQQTSATTGEGLLQAMGELATLAKEFADSKQ